MTAKLREDLTMIAEQADRCKKIVAGLLHFARQNKVVLQQTDVRELVEKSLTGVQMGENVKTVFEYNAEDPSAEVDRDQMIQVMTNLGPTRWRRWARAGRSRSGRRGTKSG